MYNTSLRGMTGLAVAIAAALPAVPVLAEEDQLVEEVVVTGSRITRKDLVSASPVQVFEREDILASGQTSLGDILREIPSVAGGAQTTQVNNGGTGAKTISLRGLGAERTLVLLNSRRLPQSALANSTTGLVGSIDLNTIPLAMVERIEVLKDGASAIYGSDAVAGVVNVITRDDFQGVELNARYGETGEGDGETTEMSLTFGDATDTGHFVFDATYAEEEPILVGDREWASTPLASVGGDVIFLGSSAPPWGNYTIPSLGTSVTLGPDYAGGPITAPDGQGFQEFSFFGGDSYNFAPVNYQRQYNKRWMLTFDGERSLNDVLPALNVLGEVNLFAEAQYIDRESEQRLAEVPLAPLIFFGYTGAPYSADNAHNPFDEDIADWRRRMVEGGPRTEPADVETKRVVLGLNGTQGEWSWETYYLYGEVTGRYRFGDLYNLERVANAVGPTTTDPVTGELTCVNDPNNCVPLDVFGENSVTQEMLDYITFTTNESAGAEIEMYAFDIANAEIFQLPAGPVGLAVGASRREESGFDNPDSQVASLAAANAVTGTPRLPTSGGYDVNAVYGELVIPLLGDLPLIQSLELDLAHRYSDYDTFGTTNNSKVGLKWRLDDQLMLRGTFSEAFRAPQISDLFGGAGRDFPQLSDPCATDATDFCIADGVPAGGYQAPSTQIPTLVGGSDELEPEEADIYTVGLVYEPAWLDGAALTVDYYDIELENAISTLGADFILAQCAETGELCELVTRFQPGSGGVIGAPSIVDDRTTNVGGVDTSGVDVGLTYNGLATAVGTFDFRVESTYIDSYEKEVAGGRVIEHAGRFIDDQDGWFGEWKVNGNVFWTWRNFMANYQLRWIDSAEETVLDALPGFPPRTRTVQGQTYHDVQVGFDLPERGFSFRLGVDNLTDNDPPLSLDGFNDNTDVRTFDTAGRYIYGSIRYTR